MQQTAAGATVQMYRPADLAEAFPYLDHTQVVGARMGSLKEGSFDGWGLFQGIRQRAIANGATLCTTGWSILCGTGPELPTLSSVGPAGWPATGVVNTSGAGPPRWLLWSAPTCRSSHAPARASCSTAEHQFPTTVPS
ncbi:MAG: hypothetical protein R2706_12225 [Acidimicrobiales bacterium]